MELPPSSGVMNRGEGWAPYPGRLLPLRESQRERWTIYHYRVWFPRTHETSFPRPRGGVSLTLTPTQT